MHRHGGELVPGAALGGGAVGHRLVAEDGVLHLGVGAVSELRVVGLLVGPALGGQAGGRACAADENETVDLVDFLYGLGSVLKPRVASVDLGKDKESMYV